MTVEQFKQKYVKEAEEVLTSLPKRDRENLAMYFAKKFLDEIEAGLEGGVKLSEAPFFKEVDRMYDETLAEIASPVDGCYFCDRSIDGNAVPFNENVPVCMTCQEKVGNLLQAFGIHPQVLFPLAGVRKHQKVLYDHFLPVPPSDGEAVH